MKSLGYIAIVAAVISLIVGVISRFTLTPVAIAGGLEAQAFLQFTNTCLLFAAVLILLEILKK